MATEKRETQNAPSRGRKRPSNAPAAPRTYVRSGSTPLEQYHIGGTDAPVPARYSAESGGWPCPYSTYLRKARTSYIWEKRARQEHSRWSRRSRRARRSARRTLWLGTTPLTCTSVFTNGTFFTHNERLGHSDCSLSLFGAVSILLSRITRTRSVVAPLVLETVSSVVSCI